jgi:hypothetical protein
MNVLGRDKINEAIEDIGELVSQAGGEGDDALDVFKDVAGEYERLTRQLAGAVEDQEQADARYYAMRDDRDRLQALLDAHKGLLRDALNRLTGGQ